jgi:hypothetical protein
MRLFSLKWKMHRSEYERSLSVFTLCIGALCFVAFVTAFQPDAVSAVSGRNKPEYCKAEAWPKDGCRQQVFAAVSCAVRKPW